MQKNFLFLEILNYNIRLSLTESKNKKHTISAFDLWNVLGNFAVKILYNLNTVKNMLKNMSLRISYLCKVKNYQQRNAERDLMKNVTTSVLE
jgi:hypothetical protein